MSARSDDPRRPVAVIEWNHGGHHETYLVFFVAALLRAGRPVIALCREPARLDESLAAKGVPRAGLRSFAIRGAEWLEARRKWPFGLGFRAYARSVRAALRGAERAGGGVEAELYFACLYEHQTRMIDAVLAGLPGRVWSGLYMQAHAYHRPGVRAPGVKKKWPVKRLWARPGLRGLLMLDEGMAPRVEADIGRPVALAPDLAESACREDEPLAAEAKRRAGGKPSAGLLGHLLPSKGVGTLARALIDDGAPDLAALLAGEVHWAMFGEEETALLRRLRDGERANVWLREGRVPDEPAYNALLRSCDVLCAAYRDFPHSSNTLTKAAIFERPVVVSEGHLMARRVREYRLGEVVPQDDPAALLAALRGIARDPAAWRERTRPRWAEYRELHSEARLASVLAGFFAGGAGAQK